MQCLDRARAFRDRHRYKGTTVKGTRRRALPMMGVGLASLGTMYALVGSGVLAVNFTTSDHQFAIYSNYIQGVSAGGFLAQNKGYSAAGQLGVTELGIKTAKLAGLCAIAHQNVPGIGETSFIITAGAKVPATFDNSTNPSVDGAGNPITYDANGLLTGSSLDNAINATDLFLNATTLAGYGNKISGLNLGQNAADTSSATGNTGSSPWPDGQTPPTAGDFGLTAQNLNVGALHGDSFGVNLAGQINLPGLKLSVKLGDKTQADCPTN